MQWKSLALIAAAAASLAAVDASTSHYARAACDPGVKIDRSTVADARKKIEAAGYQKVSDLKKGCDNYWHAKAQKNGTPVFVVLAPDGKVMEEGD